MAFNDENLNLYQRMLPFKRLLAARGVYTEKEELSQILRMLVGLRKSWASTAHVVCEGSDVYSTPEDGIDKARDKACDKEEITQKTRRRLTFRLSTAPYEELPLLLRPLEHQRRPGSLGPTQAPLPRSQMTLCRETAG